MCESGVRSCGSSDCWYDTEEESTGGNVIGKLFLVAFCVLFLFLFTKYCIEKGCFKDFKDKLCHLRCKGRVRQVRVFVYLLYIYNYMHLQLPNIISHNMYSIKIQLLLHPFIIIIN